MKHRFQYNQDNSKGPSGSSTQTNFSAFKYSNKGGIIP